MNKGAPINHTPIDLGLGESVSPAGRLRLSYSYDYGDQFDVDELIADFGLGLDFSRWVRITFESALVFRVLDETWLSTSTNSQRWTGELSTFAREVVGDDFSTQHELLFGLYPEAKHYQFVTGSACLDVLSVVPPRFELLQ